MQNLRTLKYKFLTNVKILVYKYIFDTYYELKNIQHKEIIIHHHSGLGDAIICNGMVNFLSKKFDKVYLASFRKIHDHLEYLYSENKKVELLIYDNAIELYRNKKLPVLRIGFEKNSKNFNTSFYEQLNLDYQISYDNFHLPIDEKKQQELLNHLLKVYEIDNEYALIHQVSSYGEVEINLKDNLKKIFVEKETDIFKNIFLYKKVIENAKEVHCIDSSFLHLVERVDTKADLFFHNYKTNRQKPEKLILKKDWLIIE